jgi:hypothetical protein
MSFQLTYQRIPDHQTWDIDYTLIVPDQQQCGCGGEDGCIVGQDWVNKFSRVVDGVRISHLHARRSDDEVRSMISGYPRGGRLVEVTNAKVQRDI